MKNVDYQKLSEQYAGFLVAIGGVSITVLTLVLTFSNSTKLAKGDLGSYLVLALLVATICCFIGAQMMAETAAFISYCKEKLAKEKLAKENPSQETRSEGRADDRITPKERFLGKRLFLLASINIFLAVILLLFALLLLPTAFEITNSDTVQSISFWIFLIVVIGTLIWLFLGVLNRGEIKGNRTPIISLGIISLVILLILYVLPVSNKSLLGWTFLPVVLLSVMSLLYFTLIFNGGDEVSDSEIILLDVCVFSFATNICYAVILAAAFRTISDG